MNEIWIHFMNECKHQHIETSEVDKTTNTLHLLHSWTESQAAVGAGVRQLVTVFVYLLLTVCRLVQRIAKCYYRSSVANVKCHLSNVGLLSNTKECDQCEPMWTMFLYWLNISLLLCCWLSLWLCVLNVPVKKKGLSVLWPQWHCFQFLWCTNTYLISWPITLLHVFWHFVMNKCKFGSRLKVLVGLSDDLMSFTRDWNV